jgi:hypothetical protein
MAKVINAAAARDAAVRTWFQAVHLATYPAQGPALSALDAYPRQRLIQWHVEQHRHQNGADEIERTAGKETGGAGRAPRQQRRDDEDDASRRGSEQRRHEPGIDRGDIDGLHARDALLGRQAGEGVHHERREGEEDAGNQPATECGGELQREKQGHAGLPSTTWIPEGRA